MKPQAGRAKATSAVRAGRAARDSARIRWPALAGAAVIAVAASVAYLPSLGGAFVYDDILLLTDNHLIKAADGLYRFWFTPEPIDYWPVTNTSLWIEWRLWGMQSTGYHVVGLTLHIVECLLIWRILWLLSVPGAFLAALLFALHPVNVETIAWIAQRKSQLAALFVLLSILAHLHAESVPTATRTRPPLASGWYWCSLAAFAMGMLSKVSAVIVVPVLLLIVWWRRAVTRRDLVRLLPFLAIAGVLLSVNLWFRARGAEPVADETGLVERVLGAAGVIWFYLYKAVLPIDLMFIYPQWHVDAGRLLWWLPLIATVGVTATLWCYRRGWSRPLFFAWSYFCMALLPVMGFTDVGFEQHIVVADHYQHLALIAVAALAGAGWAAWRRRPGASPAWLPDAAAVAVAGVLAVLTWQQSGLYADGITLYRDTLARNPGAWVAHNNLGGLLFDAGRLAEAMEHDQRALQLKPDYAEAHNNLGNVLQRMGRRPEAIVHYRQALQLRPRYAPAHNNLAAALAADGQLDEAIGHLEQALRLKPGYPDAQYNLELARELKNKAAVGAPVAEQTRP
jgi:tetratricopeptide (TPR) repeat protein